MKVLSHTVVASVQSIYGKFTIAGVAKGTDIEFVILLTQFNDSWQLIAIWWVSWMVLVQEFE